MPKSGKKLITPLTRKQFLIIYNIIILAIIMSVFLIVQNIDVGYYHEMTTKQAQNDVETTAYKISSEIESATIEQRVMSDTMAHDNFLIGWFRGDENLPSQKRLFRYLKGMQNEFHYNNVFLVSANSRKYYYQGGVNKIISPTSNFDQWYYNFLKLNQDYDIQIDRDETNNDAISIFANYRLVDNNGNLLGVVGCGNTLNNLEKEIATYEDKYGVSVYITNIGNAHNSFRGVTRLYVPPEEIASTFSLKEDEIKSLDGGNYMRNNYYITIMHIRDLSWNLIVVKSLGTRFDAFGARMKSNALYIVLCLLLFAMFASFIVSMLNRELIRMENTDNLTRIPNRALLKSIICRKGKLKKGWNSVFMVDIDDFKQYNDNRGHEYGDYILTLVAEELDKLVNKEGIAARYGGDEFIGVMRLYPADAGRLLDGLNFILQNKNVDMPVHVSIGVAGVRQRMNFQQMVNAADDALYEAKDAGKARTVVKDM